MNEEKYKIVNGTAYHVSTSDEVVKILENARKTGQRIRIFYGDSKTGRDWMEIWDTIGTVGRSCGEIKIPLLIRTSRSLGGPAIMDHCIVKITIDKKVVYQHPKYHLPVMEIKEATEILQKDGYFYSVFANGVNMYNCKTKEAAGNEVAFLKGFRNKTA